MLHVTFAFNLPYCLHDNSKYAFVVFLLLIFGAVVYFVGINCCGALGMQNVCQLLVRIVRPVPVWHIGVDQLALADTREAAHFQGKECFMGRLEFYVKGCLHKQPFAKTKQKDVKGVFIKNIPEMIRRLWIAEILSHCYRSLKISCLQNVCHAGGMI